MNPNPSNFNQIDEDFNQRSQVRNEQSEKSSKKLS